ncbi:hypothetical protein P9112_010431 [Eukaryota sp. TZLM1-RC]
MDKCLTSRQRHKQKLLSQDYICGSISDLEDQHEIVVNGRRLRSMEAIMMDWDSFSPRKTCIGDVEQPSGTINFCGNDCQWCGHCQCLDTLSILELYFNNCTLEQVVFIDTIHLRT